jgi:hypothetical protein
MKSPNCLAFLQDKIQEIGSALLYNESSSVLKFPSTIVSAIKVDDVANIWFVASRPEQCLQEFDQEFPSHLQCYRKGKGYYLQITGRARIINDPEEISELIDMPEDIKTRALKDLVLIKVKIGSAKYYENPVHLSPTSIKGLFSRFSNWLFGDNLKKEQYSFQLAPRLSFN